MTELDMLGNEERQQVVDADFEPSETDGDTDMREPTESDIDEELRAEGLDEEWSDIEGPRTLRSRVAARCPNRRKSTSFDEVQTIQRPIAAKETKTESTGSDTDSSSDVDYAFSKLRGADEEAGGGIPSPQRTIDVADDNESEDSSSSSDV